MSLKYCATEDFVLIVTTFRISNATLPNFLAVKLSKQRFKHYESFTRVPDTRGNLSIFCPIHHICYLFQYSFCLKISLSFICLTFKYAVIW